MECQPEQQSTVGTIVTNEDFLRFSVPGDGSCLFWAVAMAYLLPVRNNDSLFNERFDTLFDSTDTNRVRHVQQLLLKFPSNSAYEDETLRELVTKVFRNRVVDEVTKQEAKVYQSVTLDDFVHMKNETFITDGDFTERFQTQFQSQTHLVDLNQMKAKRLDEKSIELMNAELDKISDKDLVQKFKFHCYLESMRNRKSWGGEHEILAIHELINIQVLIFINENRDVRVNLSDLNICLFNTNQVHYEFGLVKAEVVIEALKSKNYQSAAELINVGVDNIDFQDKNGDSLLHFAVLSDNHNDLINKLVFQGADLNLKNNQKKTPSGLAKEFKLKKSLAILNHYTNETTGNEQHEQKMTLNSTHTSCNEDGLNALHLAVEEGNEATVTLLLSSLAKHPHLAKELIEVPTNNDKEQTALHLAVLNKRLKVVKCLIEHGADVNATDKASVSALSYAARDGHERIVYYLVNNGADINSVDQHGMSPVHHAVKCGQWNSAKCLVEHEADLNVADERGATPVSGVVKEGEWDMVRYLLENGALLIGLSDDVKEDVFRRFVDLGSDAERQFNQAVKLGNVEILETLIRNQVNQSDANIEELLAKTYDHLKVLNLRLNQNICIYIENKLLNFRFNSDKKVKSKQNGGAIVDLNNVKERIELIVSCIDRISVLGENDEVSDTFLFIGKFIAQNLQVLKVQLSFTYNVLPWEEMQFCLITFLSSHVHPQNVEFINKLILCKQKLLLHLKLFGKKLENLEINADEKILKNKKKMDRESAVSNILKSTPEFSELYQNGEILKDVYSLKRIEMHIRIVCSIDLKAKPLIGQLAIERTLQVIGECLKNTLITPSMSDTVQNMLIQNAPLNVKQIITSLRDSLSHVNSLSKRADVEYYSDPDFFTKMQDDLRKLNPEINFILFNRKLEAVKLFLKRIIKCKSEYQVWCMASGVRNNEKVNMVIGDQFHKTFYKMVDLIEDFKNLIEEKTELQVQCFEEIFEFVETNKARIEQVQNKLAKTLRRISWLVNLIKSNTNLDTIKTHAASLLVTFNLKHDVNSVYERILELTVRIHDNLTPNMKLKDQTSIPKFKISNTFHEIFSTIEFECRRIKNIDTFKFGFDKEDNEKKKRILIKQLKDKIDIKLGLFIDKISDEETRSDFEEEYERKKEIHEAKQNLVQFYEKKWPEEIGNLDQFSKIFEKLNLKLGEKESHSSLYELKDDSSCQKLVQRVNRCEDSYGKLVRKLNDEPMNEFMQDAFIDFIKSFNNFKKLGPDFVNSSKRLFYDCKIYLHKMKTIDSILGTDKSDVEILNVLKANDDVRVAIEMLMLTLIEILENINVLETNRLFLDELAPILIGKNLRNYLAHGDLLMDVLSIDHLKSIISHYRILKLNCDQHKSSVYTNNYLIGKVTLEDISKLKANYQRKLKLLRKQNELFSAAETNDLSTIQSLIDNGLEMNFRKSNGWTLLHLAAQNDNLELFKFLLSYTINIYQKDVFGYSIIRHLPQFHSKDILHLLIQTNSIDVDGNLDDGKTLLHLSSQINSHEMVALLIANGANIEATDNNGTTPMEFATVNGHKDVVSTLLNAGANIKTRNKDGDTLLHLSTYLDLTNYLIDHGLSADSVNDEKETPLHIACFRGHSDVVLALLDKNANVNAKTVKSGSPLHYAAQEGYEQIVELLLTNGALVNAAAELGNTSLHMSAAKGYVKVVEALIKNGAELEAENIDEMTSLHAASMGGHHEVVKVLLEHKANVNASADGRTALHAAAVYNHLETVKILIDYKADANSKNRDGLTGLHFAAQTGNVEVIRLLLDAGSSVNDKTDNGRTALHLATYYNKIEAVKVLIERKADINAVENDEVTPVFVACFKGHFEIFKMLKDKNADVVKSDKKGCSPLHAAVQGSHKKIVDILISSITNKNCLDNLGNTPLHLAAQNAHLDMINILLKHEIDIDKSNKTGWTALHFASCNGHSKAVELLLTKHANIDRVTSDGLTAFNLAAKYGHKDVVQVLLKETNVNIDIAHGDNATPLQLASTMGHEDVVSLLLDKGADINATTEKEKWTALHLAAEKGQANIVQMLLKNGAHVNAALTDMATPLYLAAQNGHEDIVMSLLLNGANVNATYDNNKITALHVAAEIGNCDMAFCLLKAGANVDALDANGKTPLHWAAAYDQCDIIPALCKFKANANSKDAKQWTAIHVAAEKDFFQFIIKLYNCGASIHELTDTGWSAMHIACQNGHSNVTRTLLLMDKQSILINQAGFKGESPLQVAADSGHSNIVQILLEKSANINHSDSIGFTALHCAIVKGHEDTVRCLLENKTDTELKSLDGCTPLHFATALGHNAIVHALCDGGANVNSANLRKFTPLHVAAEYFNIEAANTLIQNGADVNAAKSDKATPLHLAVISGRLDMVRLLVEAGAIVNCQSNTKATPLHLATQNCYVDVIEHLLMNGADIDATCEGGFTALHLATQIGYIDSVEALLTFHPNVNAKNNNGDSPLHLALQHSRFDVIETLIKNGADVFAKNNHDSILHQAVRNDKILKLIVAEIKSKSDGERLRSAMNAEDGEGDTPLMWAVEKGNFKAVKLLLNCDGIDLNAVNLKGRTAFHWAAKNGHVKIVNLLVNKRADACIKDVNGETAFDLAYLKISTNEIYEAICAVLLSLS